MNLTMEELREIARPFCSRDGVKAKIHVKPGVDAVAKAKIRRAIEQAVAEAVTVEAPARKEERHG